MMRKVFISFDTFLDKLIRRKIKDKEFILYDKNFLFDGEDLRFLLSDYSASPLSSEEEKKLRYYLRVRNTFFKIVRFKKKILVFFFRYLRKVKTFFIEPLRKVKIFLCRLIKKIESANREKTGVKIKTDLPNKQSSKGFIFSVVAYGEHHVDVFLNYSLKSQLSPKNIPSLKNLKSCEYNIYTTPADEYSFLTHPIIDELKSYMTVNIVTNNSHKKIKENRHYLMNLAYMRGLINSIYKNKMNAFINADVFFSNGFLSKAESILKKYNTVEVVGQRVNFEKFSNCKEIKDFLKKDEAINSKKLSLIAARNMSDMMAAHLIDNRKGPKHPSQLYWKIKENAYLVFCFHICPMFFNPEGLLLKNTPSSTIDDDLVNSFDVPFFKRYFIKDANDIFCCELSKNESEDKIALFPNPSFRKMIGFYKSGNDKNRENLKVVHKFGDMSLTNKEWDSAYEKIKPVMEEIYSKI